jgi:hypothetical protein
MGNGVDEWVYINTHAYLWSWVYASTNGVLGGWVFGHWSELDACLPNLILLRLYYLVFSPWFHVLLAEASLDVILSEFARDDS